MSEVEAIQDQARLLRTSREKHDTVRRYAQAAVAANDLADLDRRYGRDGWLHRAFQAAKDSSPSGFVGEVEAVEKALAYLAQRLDSAVELEAFQIRRMAARNVGRAPDDMLETARAEIARNGGLSHEYVRGLGYESLVDFYDGPSATGEIRGPISDD